MATIEAEILNVVAIYADAFTSLTKKVAAIDLKELESKSADMQEKYTFLIHTTGRFRSAMRCEIENGLFDRIALNLNKGQELPQDSRVLYLTEYLNIICGRALSSINNVLKSASRLTVPEYISENDEKREGEYRYEDCIRFKTDYGKIQVDLKYSYAVEKEAE